MTEPPPWHEAPDPYLVKLATVKADLDQLRQRIARLTRALSQTVRSS